MISKVNIFFIIIYVIATTFDDVCGRVLETKPEAFSTFVYGDKEIGFFHEQVSYEVASGKCEKWAEGGSLIVIDDHKKQEEIENHIRENRLFNQEEWLSDDPFDPGYHVGAHDRNEEGTWVWVNAKQVGTQGFRKWGPGEPNNFVFRGSEGEDCMFLLMTEPFPGYPLGSWMDIDCRGRKYYICERGILKTQDKCKGAIENLMVDISVQSYPSCGAQEHGPIMSMSTIRSHTRYWKARNTGGHVDFDIQPKHSMRSLTHHGSMYVDKIIIKHNSDYFQHSIGGSRKVAELQVIHEEHEKLGKVVLSFLIRERRNPANRKWEGIMMLLRNIRQIDQESVMVNPPSLKRLLGDTHGPHSRRLGNMLGNQIKYEVVTANSCGKVTWIIFPRVVYLSTSQLTNLRALRTRDISPIMERHAPQAVCELINVI